MRASRRSRSRWGISLALVVVLTASGCIFSKEPARSHSADSSTSARDDATATADTGREDADTATGDVSGGDTGSDVGQRDAGGVTEAQVRAELKEGYWVTILGESDTRGTKPDAGAVTYVWFESGGSLRLATTGLNATARWRLTAGGNERYQVVVEQFDVGKCSNEFLIRCGVIKDPVGGWLSNTEKVEFELMPEGDLPTSMVGTSFYRPGGGGETKKAPMWFGRSENSSVESSDLTGTWSGPITSSDLPRRILLIEQTDDNTVVRVKKETKGGSVENVETGSVVTFDLQDTSYWGLYTAGPMPHFGGKIKGAAPADKLIYPEWGTNSLLSRQQ